MAIRTACHKPTPVCLAVAKTERYRARFALDAMPQLYVLTIRLWQKLYGEVRIVNSRVKRFGNKATHNNSTADDSGIVNGINLHHQEGTSPPQKLQQGKP